jgi:hypothetical protein
MSSRGSDPHQDLVTQLCVNGLPDPSVTGENRTQYPGFTILANTAQQPLALDLGGNLQLQFYF